MKHFSTLKLEAGKHPHAIEVAAVSRHLGGHLKKGKLFEALIKT
jgi:hypothetical protein